MVKESKKTSDTKKKQSISKLEVTLEIDKEAVDIIKNLHSLMDELDRMQGAARRIKKHSMELDIKQNERDCLQNEFRGVSSPLIVKELDSMQKAVLKTFKMAEKTLIDNQAYYSVLYEREKRRNKYINS